MSLFLFKVVTEYKNRIDKLLTETQKKYETDKEHFQDIIENCVAMKQQSVLCQVNTSFNSIDLDQPPI